jgi:DNA-binding GntR family transcriptional regulator
MGAYSTDEMRHVVRGHETILNHFLDRKCAPETVEQVVKAHLEASMTRLGKHLEKKQLLDP